MQQHRELDVVRQQLVLLVSITATVFVLCPEWLQFYRNLCVVPLLAWLTGIVFDKIIMLNNAWDNAPAMVKYFVPVKFPQITPPFEQIRGSINRRIAVANTRLRHLFLEARSVLLALVNWLLCQTGRDQHKTPQPAAKPDQWVAILVATPFMYQESAFDLGPDTVSEIYEAIPWGSSELSSVPAIFPASDFQVQLALCLIPKSTWYSSKTVLERFTTGLYWSHRPGHAACQGEQWDQEKIQTISKVQVIGHVEEHNRIHKVKECFESLQQGWDDANIYWNNIDFAIIFGFLLVGASSTEICKKMLDQFASLRIEQAQRNKRSRLGAGAAVLTLLTGGLAAPITIPMMMGVGATEMTMPKRDRLLWEERTSMCEKLSDRYEQLATIIEPKDIKVFAPTAPFSPPPPAMESSWFVDDSW
ncbi:hypothetical protein F66182_1478 [Fusarium sp. NRRL 66182]|nr:hypothetical protein F66182_1478 [Fusarium sp. NRRL 66182]